MKSSKVLIILTFLWLPRVSLGQAIPRVKASEVLQMIDTSRTPLVINFWATWCRPCVDEMPVLEKVAARYRSKGVKLILVSMDFKQDYPAHLENFVQKQGYTSPVYWLDESNPLAFCRIIDSHWTARIPATLMVNNAKHYREFYYYGMVPYQAEAYFKDLIR